MPVTTNLGLAVSSDQRDYVLEYWMKMLNEENGNFVLLDNEFGVLASKLSFTIYPETWVPEDHAPFYFKSVVTMNAVVQDNSIVEAYFEDILVASGVILHSITQNGTELELVFYADSAKLSQVKGFVKYVYSAPGADPLPTPSANVASKTFSANGTYNAHDENKDGYNPITIDVTANVVPLSVSANGTYPIPSNADGYGPVSVNVPDTGAAIIDGTLEEIENATIKYIRSSAFIGISTLTRVSFPNCINIGSSAFLSCKYLLSINFPNCIELGGAAFSGCNMLGKVEMPNLLKASNTSTFAYCTLLSKVSIPRCYQLGDSAFQSCGIKEINCSFVGALYSYAFANNPIKEIKLLRCTTLGTYCFQYCRSLTSCYFGAAECAIRDYAFQQCSSLRYVLGCFSSIPGNCFANFSYFSEFYQMNASTIAATLGTNAFNSTAMVNSTYLGYYGSIYVHPNRVDLYKSATNWVALSDRIVAAPQSIVDANVWAYEFYQSTLTEVPSEKANVEVIGQYAFQSCSQLSEASFHECICINKYAFQYCSALSSVSFPKCLFIDAAAFAFCSSLSSVSFPKCFAIEGYAFSSCSNLTEANFPECLEVGNYAFTNCSALSSVSFPKCVKLQIRAFENCRSLISVNFPECIEISGAFYGCSNLRTINFPKCSLLNRDAFNGCTSLTEVNFPEGLTVSYTAFFGCTSLSSISFPKCTSLGEYAFQNCSSLTEVNFPECLTINYQAFYGCSNLRTINFPKCSYISASAFQNCSKLESAIFSQCYKIMGSAFNGCYSLSTISFPLVSQIYDRAFYQCSSLESANLPNCRNLGQSCFMYCSNLRMFSMPQKFSFGANGIFFNCSKLESVYFLGSEVGKTDWEIFDGTPLSNSTYLGHYGSIFVRASLLSEWQSGYIFSNYSDRFVGLTDEQIAALDNQ